MDLHDIIEEIIPWIILLALWWPAIKNLKKKKKARADRRINVSDIPDVTVDDSVKPVPSEFFDAIPAPPVLPATPRKKNKRVQAPKPAAPAYDLPQEGVPAVNLAPMAPVQPTPRATGAKRELRRALVIGEILQRKF